MTRSHKQKKKYIAPNVKVHKLQHQANLLDNSYHGDFSMIHAEESIERS